MKTNLFTIIQLLCLGILWVVKLTPAAMAFPLVLLLLIPLRLKLLPFMFSEDDLKRVDTHVAFFSTYGHLHYFTVSRISQ